MKKITRWKVAAGIFMVWLPLLGGSGQESSISPSTDLAKTNQEPLVVAEALTNAPSAESAEQQLENAPAEIVSTPSMPPENIALGGSAAEIVRLAQAGVDENVMLSFVTNSANTFDLSADAIIYLNDLGVPATVVTSMIQHDQTLKSASFNPTTASTSPGYTNVPVPEPGTAPQYPPADSGTVPTDSSGQTTEMTGDTAANEESYGSSTYFYNTLAPYGNWINVAGYGLCWRPTAVVMNRGWQPYCNNGYWVYSNCGWYWASDYSWGWAPFHYGRWFYHYHMGWCWTPDTVWGPSWVSWRYTGGYCGWAPLPPTACFTPGRGFTCLGRPVGVGFGFGLNSRSYTFVPTASFYGRRPYYHRVPHQQVNQFFRRTAVINQIVQDNDHRIINKGIPVNHIAAATRSNIRPIRIRESTDGNSLQAGRLNPDGSLMVFRPDFPASAGPGLHTGGGVNKSPITGTVRTGAGIANGDFPAPTTPGFNNRPTTSWGSAPQPASPTSHWPRQGPSTLPGVSPSGPPAIPRSAWSPAVGSKAPSRPNNVPVARPGPVVQPRMNVPTGPRTEMGQSMPNRMAAPVQQNPFNGSGSAGSYRQNTLSR